LPCRVYSLKRKDVVMVRVQLCGCPLMLAVVPSGPLCIERVYEFPRATYKSRIRLRHPGAYL
jgi:hypothetical protein